MLTSRDETIDTAEIRVLWFKPIGVVVDSGVSGSGNISYRSSIISGGGQTRLNSMNLQDLLDVS